MRKVLVATGLISVATLACSAQNPYNHYPTPTQEPISASSSPSKSISRGISQFPTGALNPAVNQSTIGSTICVRGYTKKIRVRLSTKKGYQHDHFIPLELGGDPINPNNLWFVPNNRAHKDDEEENRLHRLVCNHTLTLIEAQSGTVFDPSLIEVFCRTIREQPPQS